MKSGLIYAFIDSGDGDFHCLVEYLENQTKLLAIGIPNKAKFSALLRKFIRKFDVQKFYVDELRKKVEYIKRGALEKGQNPKPSSPSLSI